MIIIIIIIFLMARGRSRPSPFTIEMMSMPQSGLMGYYFPWNNMIRTYDTSSYNPAYSDNSVSPQDIQVLLGDLQAQPLFSPVYCDPWLYGICGLFLLLIVGQMIFVFSASKRIGTNFYVIPLIFFLFFGLMVAIICKVQSNARKRAAERKLQIDTVLARHQQTTFGGKNVILRMSMHGAYLAIEFAFRMGAAGGQMQMNQGMVMNPYAQGNFTQPNPQFNYQQPQPFVTGQQPQPFVVAGQQPQPYKVSAPIF